MTAHIRCYRYGSKREKGEGLRIGVTRYVPRGVKRSDWQRKGYFDVWMPLLAPSAGLVSKYMDKKLSFAVFARRYRAEMKKSPSHHLIELLATMGLFQQISLGCFCEDELLCHRSVLAKLLLEESRKRAPGFARLRENLPLEETLRFTSPVCFGHNE